METKPFEIQEALANPQTMLDLLDEIEQINSVRRAIVRAAAEIGKLGEQQ